MSVHEIVSELATGRARYERSIALQAEVFLGRVPERQPLLLSCPLTPAQERYPAHDLRSIHFDPERMLERELKGALSAMNGGREAVPSVRANMGCGIVPALFGVEPLLFEDKMPWVKSHRAKEALRETEPTLTPEFRRALAHMEFQAQALGDCGCRLYPLDIQGAVDTAHIVLGDDFFYELYDDPAFIESLLEKCVRAILFAFEECMKRIPGARETVCHYNALAMPRALGGLKLSEDTSTLLSAAHISAFVAPALRESMEKASGGYVHYCGRNPHLYEAVCAEPLVHGLNFGNPEMQDMEKVLRDCAKRGRVFYGPCAQRPEERREDYFRRVLRAACDEEGRIWLLLPYTCPVEEAERVSDCFDQVVEEVRRG